MAVHGMGFAHTSLFRLAVAAVLILPAGLLRRGHTAPVPPGPPNAGDALCALKSPAEWQAFLERAADHEEWVATCEDKACDQEYYRFVLATVFDPLKHCRELIRSHPAIERCTHNLRRFLPAWMHQHDGVSYGFTVPNRVYLRGQESPDRPAGMMRPPAAIVAALPDRARVEAAARENGWRYLTHDSGLGGSRTFVVVPDERGRFDQWMLLNLQDAKSEIKSETPLSVLAVQKKDAAGRTLDKVRVHFRDYTISRAGRTYELVLNEQSNGKCYSCHPNGVRQLIARRTPVLDAQPVRGEEGFGAAASREFAYERLMEFNRRLRSYGAPDWEGKVNPADHGPALGRAQGCTDCHDGKSRAALNVSSSTEQIELKMFHELGMPTDTTLPRLVERAQMKNPALTAAEAAELDRAYASHETMTRDFEDSRFPELKRWILENPCR